MSAALAASPAPRHLKLIQETVGDEGAFVRAVFSGPAPGQALPWVRVVIRPVQIKGRRHMQFSYFEKDKDITKNYSGPEITERLDELLQLPFQNIHLHTTRGEIHISLTAKGTPTIRTVERDDSPQPLDLAHDRAKESLLGDRSRQFLQRMGIVTRDGTIKAGMARKLAQINEFLKLLQHSGELEHFERFPIVLADLGCGSASLTFAAYHYVNEILGLPTRLIGVDIKSDLIARQASLAKAMGWTDVTFHAARIAEFAPQPPPDIVLALHACDTATDEALAAGIRWQSRLILSVPCCHHYLQEQLDGDSAPPPFEPVFRHGILGERWCDILTDTFRALILRIMGFRTDVIEFVSTEHTARNLMIRAVRSSPPGDRRFVQEYLRLKEFWRVRPYLEVLLDRELQQYWVT